MKTIARSGTLFAFLTALLAFDEARADSSSKPVQRGAGPDSWIDDLGSIGPEDWSYARAGHLLERAGFGGTPEEIEKLAAMTPRQAVDYLVDYDSIDAGHLPDFDPSNIWDDAMLPDADDRLAFGQALGRGYRRGSVYGRTPAPEGTTRRYQEIVNTLYTKYFTSNREWNRVAIWWANRMLTTPRPLEEKMTLFWHGHFATEERDVLAAQGIAKDRVLKLSDEFGFHPNLLGWERLFKEGHMAIAHGCSYPNPNRSHFESMRFWHTGVPNAPEKYGWLGRFADAYDPEATSSYIVNIATEQKAAVVSANHSAVVFSDPDKFTRLGSPEQAELFEELARKKAKTGNDSLDFVRAIGSTAGESSEFIRHACAEFRGKAEYGYGSVGPDLRRIIAQINADAPTRIYYANFGNFDTHSSQATAQSGLFNQIGDAVHAFYYELDRIGRADDVALMIFTEFGRQVKENASLGTDHGVAGPMFIVGKHVKGGFYGEHPSLTDLDEGDLKMTTDFRSVYATMIKEWMGYDDTKSVLKAEFPTLGVLV